jgi:MFS family permease
MSSLPPEIDSLSTSQPAAKSKLWTVGTLTYTRTKLFVLFFWLLWGDFAWSMKERAVPPILQILFKQFGAADTFVGILVGSVPAIIAMVLGPIISYKSDRHRGRWGRRIPYLLLPTPIAVVSMLGLAFCPVIGKFAHQIAGTYSLGVSQTILICYAVFWTLFTVSSTIGNAVFGGLINDVVPESVLGRFFGAFRAIGLIAGILFSFWVMGKAETQSVWIFLGMAILYGFSFTVMCLKVKEGDYPSPPHKEEHGVAGFLAATKIYFKECFSESYYCWFFISIALSWMVFIPVNLFSVFFANSVNMSMDSFGTCMAIAYLISFLISYPLGVLVDRFHPLRCGLAIQLIYIVVTLWGGLFTNNSWTLGVVLVIQCVLAGTWMTATASLLQRLLPKERFAQFASASAIVTSLGTIVVSPIIGIILDLTGHIYRYTFLASSLLALGALATGLVVYAKFIVLGGPDNYIAPE